MAWRILAATAGAAAAAGMAVAQGGWTTVTRDDVEVCRPVLEQVHAAEHRYIQEDIDRYCRRSSRYFDDANCRFMREWMSESRAEDPVDWFFRGNGKCDGSDYPCFGPDQFNSTPRSPEEARARIGFAERDAAQAPNVAPDMDLWDATFEGDRCIARVWLDKHRGVSSPPPRSPSPVVAASPAAPRMPDLGPPPSSPPPPLLAPAPEASRAPALAAAPPPEKPGNETDACLAASDATPESLARCTGLLAAMKPDDQLIAPMLIALVQMNADAGKPVEALRYGDRLVNTRTGLDAIVTRCAVRKIAKWDLDAGLAACISLGPTHAGAMEAAGQIHLLAGRWEDAWKAFDAAHKAGGAGQALYLRGLASAGMGEMAEALKDMAAGEAAAPGSAQAYDSDGYSLGAVSKGKPLAPPEAFAPAVIPKPPAQSAAPAAQRATPVLQPVAATPSPAPLAAPAAPPALPRFEPDAPRPRRLSLSISEMQACEEDFAAMKGASERWQGGPDEVSLNLAMLQRTLYASRCAAHPQASEFVSSAEREIAEVAPRAVSSQTTADQTTPVATDCLTPVPVGATGNASASSIFRNSCGFDVMVAYCNIAPASGSWAEMFACETPSRIALVSVPADGSAPVVFGRQINHFACRAPALPAASYSPGPGLEGFCK